MRRAFAGAAAVLSLVALSLVACTGELDREPRAGPTSGPPVSPPVSTLERPRPPMAVIAHATVPQLRLTAAQADRLASGKVRRWRGFRVVAGAPPARAIRDVEADPGTLGVVPLSAVGPSVVAATVEGRDPVRDRDGAIDVTVTGDIMPVRGVPDARAAFAPLRDRLRAADLTVGNLEAALSRNGRPTQGDDSFGAGPWLVPILRDAGFDAVSVANNHVGDFGEGALLETLRTLRTSRLRAFGAGRDVAEASKAALLRVDGVRFAFLGVNAIGETPRATEGDPGALSVRMPPRTGPLVPADLDRMAATVTAYDGLADVVVVLPHWGEQYLHTPEPVQRVVARRLVRAGADLVAGGHPHWVQGLEEVDGVPVVHSLGNLVFDMDFSEETMEGVLLEATFWGRRLKAVRLVPYRMDPTSFAPRVVRGDAARGILADLWGSSRGPWAG